MIDIKNIKDYEKYLIDEYGNIFSKNSKKFLKSQTVKRYKKVRLFNEEEKIGKFLSIHRLVAEAFISNPENKPLVNHKDGNKNNNHYTNLEWCTAKENTEHATLIGLRKVYSFSEKRNVRTAITSRKFSLEEENEIRLLYKEIKNQTEIARMFNVSRQTIGNIINSKYKVSDELIKKYT